MSGTPATPRPSSVAALAAVETMRAAGGRAGYLVLPPGAGKTAVGLELARREGRRTLVLTPSSVVQRQWLDAARSCEQPRRTGSDLDCEVVVLTYAALSDVDRSAGDAAETPPETPSVELDEQRRAAIRAEPGSDQLSLLHSAGRELVARAGRRGPWTLLLDEAHHLLSTWGPLVPALAEALGEQTVVVGLTASSPALLPARAASVQHQLFGPPLLDVAPPRAVRDGDIAPYQELLHLSEPTPDELRDIAADAAPFEALRRALIDERRGTLPLLDWLYRRLHAPHPGWPAVERDEPALARAGLRLVNAGLLPLPAGARLREQHRVPADGQDWAALLGGYSLERLQPSSEPGDADLLRAVLDVLPRLGWVLTEGGLRRTTAAVERSCTGSLAKQAAALEVLTAEQTALGDALRALVVCDAETADAPAVTAQGCFAAIAASELGPVLRPVLATGRTLALRRDDLAALRAFSPATLADRLVATPLPGTRALVQVTAGPGWAARTWVPLVADWLAAGGTQLVIGTRGVLGEGWDCPPVNAVLDLTASGTAATAWSVRGRGLHRDPSTAPLVADLWSFACVADGHPHGGADYLRIARLHAAQLAPDRDGRIGAGIGHCDEALLPATAPDSGTRAAANGRALVRPGERDRAQELWRVDGGYDDVERSSLLVRSERPFGLAGRVVPATGVHVTATLSAPSPPPVQPVRRTTRLWPLPVTGGVAAAAAGTALQGPLLGTGAGLGAGLAVGAAVGGLRYGRQLRAVTGAAARPPDAVLDQLAAVVADALSCPAGVRRSATRGGWTSLALHAPSEQSARFASCLDTLLAPLADPRWIVSRLVLTAPSSASERRRLAAARAVGRAVDAAVVWHAVPAPLSRSRSALAGFEAAWRRHVGPGRLLRTTDGEGAALLELLRGEDPFALTTRLRTTWE